MATSSEILTTAKQRGQTDQLPYAGAVTPSEAFALLEAEPAVMLVDVRTNAERDWVGRVAIQNAQHTAVQWSQYPGGVQNPDFLAQLAQIAEKGTPLLFLCRSGVRSLLAAKLASEHGYSNCFNIL